MKKKGSALILSILMLSFFMTITLTMYYIARNRNKRSIYKIQGMRIDSGLDSGSAIAHYELYLADEYVSQGHLYESPATTSYGADSYPTTPPAITQRYTTELITTDGAIELAPKTGEHYTGVVLNNYNEYFGARWDATTGTAITVTTGSSISDSKILIQPWIAEDKVIGGKIVSRAWMNNTGEKIVRLWSLDKGKDDVEAISIGGYRLIESGIGTITTPVDTITTAAITGNLSTVDPINTSNGYTILVYEKIVSISNTEIEEEKYKITYEEIVTTSGGSIISDKLNHMIVEKIN